jgi:uncharacterized protein (DUF58 family)
MARLLEPGFIRELEVLRRRMEVRARSGQGGEHLARRRGGSSEFHEHRPYADGDDLRRIDWAAYARTDAPVIKVFRAEEDVIARLVVDTSASMGVLGKLLVAQRLAAAIGYLALASSERAQLLAAAEGLAREQAPSRGRGGLAALLRSLEGLAPGGRTDLTRAVDAVVRRSPRPGLCAVVSDFLDPGPVLSALGRAAMAGHDVALVHVVAPEEEQPGGEGDFELEDAETGARVEVTLDHAALEAYALRFAGLCEELRAWARKHGAIYLRVRTDEPLEPALRRFVARSVD